MVFLYDCITILRLHYIIRQYYTTILLCDYTTMLSLAVVMLWYGIVQCGVLWCGVVIETFGVVWCGVA